MAVGIRILYGSGWSCCYRGCGGQSLKMYVKNLTKISLDEHITIDEKGEPVSDCAVSFFNPTHICALLCNYSALKEDCYGKFS